MAREIYRKIIELVLEAARIARGVGIENLLQPGLVKEMIIADHLGHRLIVTKRDADACSEADPNALYEYLSCKEGGTGQLDRMFKEPIEKRTESLSRIARNSRVFFAVFYRDDRRASRRFMNSTREWSPEKRSDNWTGAATRSRM